MILLFVSCLRLSTELHQIRDVAALEGCLRYLESSVEEVLLLLGEIVTLDPRLDGFVHIAVLVVDLAQLCKGNPHGVFKQRFLQLLNFDLLLPDFVLIILVDCSLKV